MSFIICAVQCKKTQAVPYLLQFEVQEPIFVVNDRLAKFFDGIFNLFEVSPLLPVKIKTSVYLSTECALDVLCENKFVCCRKFPALISEQAERQCCKGDVTFISLCNSAFPKTFELVRFVREACQMIGSNSGVHQPELPVSKNLLPN